MANKAENKAKQEAVQVDQISSIYKAHPGHKVIATEVTFGAKLAHKEDEILGIGWFWMEDGTKKLCYAVEVPEEEGTELKADFERSKAANRRKNRCRITSPKTGKKIMCPFTNTCTGCPHAGKLTRETGSDFSIESMSAVGHEVQSTGFGTASNTLLGIELDELMEKLKRDEPDLLYMIVLRDDGLKDEDIWQAMGIGNTKYYKELKKLRTLTTEYVDLNY